MTVVVGADGARGAWVAASLDRRRATLHPAPAFADVLAIAAAVDACAIGVDMPIALAATAPRQADVEARALLGSRRSTLFPTPVIDVLEASDYDDACRRSRAACGKAISKQAWNLMPMVRQVRAQLTSDDAERVFEVHPESTFVQLTGEPLPSKKTAAGVGRRLAALRQHIDNLDEALARAPADCAVDDAIDALTVAVSARRFVDGDAVVFGNNAGSDPTGHPLRIIA